MSTHKKDVQLKDLSAPLLGTTAERQVDVSLSRHESAQRATVLIAKEARYLLCGICLFAAGFVVNGASFFWDQIRMKALTHGQDLLHLKMKTKMQMMEVMEVRGWWFAFGAFLQTVGLLLMVFANLDINVYLHGNRLGAKVFALSIIAHCGFYGISGLCQDNGIHGPLQSMWLPIIPAIYLCCRFDKIMQMEKHFPRFTEIFNYVVLLDLMGQAMWFFFFNFYGKSFGKPPMQC